MTTIAAAGLHSNSRIARRFELLRAAWERLFGYDFFISYAWADGRIYAQALAERLSELNYRNFLDEKEMGGGTKWRASARRALRRSSVLILIATPKALESDNVFEELETFNGRGKPLVPIDIGGNIDRLPRTHRLFPLIEQRIRKAELIVGKHDSPTSPSSTVIDFLNSAFRFVRVDRLKSISLLLVIGFFALLAAGLAVSVLAERAATTRAEERRMSAVARQLAAESQIAIGSSPDDLARATLLAIESIRHKRTPEGDAALRRSLSLTARGPIRSWPLQYTGEIGDATIDGQAKFIAFETDKGIRFQSIETGELRSVIISQGHSPFAFSWPSNSLAVSEGHSVKVIDFNSGAIATCYTDEEEYPGSVAISADGKLVMAAGSSPTLQHLYFALWKIDGSECERAEYQPELNVPVTVAFSPTGTQAAVGGFAFRTANLNSFSIVTMDAWTKCNCETGRFEESSGANIYTRVSIFAGGPDTIGNFVTVTVASRKSDGISIWAHAPGDPFREQVRISDAGEKRSLLGFTPSGHSLLLLNRESKVIEEWPAYGLRSHLRTLESAERSPVEVLSFDSTSGILRTNVSEVRLPTPYTGELMQSQMKDANGISAVRSDAWAAIISDLARNAVPDGTLTIVPSAVAKDSSGRIIAIAGSENGKVELQVWSASHYDRAKWALVGRFNLNEPAKAVAVNGGLIAAAIGNDAVVWELENAEPIARIRHLYNIAAIALSDDGKFLATSTADEETKPSWGQRDDLASEVWPIDTPSLLKLACEAVSQKELDRGTEWPRYMGDEPFRNTCSATF
jgi:WD40 repeat protein